MAWMNKWLKAPRRRLLSTILAIILALPLGLKGLTGLYAWFSPFIFLNSFFLLKSLVIMNILGFSVLLLSIFRKRWFCRNMCPVGYGCDLVSGCSWRKKFSLYRFPRLGRWMALISLAAALFGFPLFILLDPLSIFNGFFAVLSKEATLSIVISFLGLPVLLISQLFFPGSWCGRLCPLGGLQDEIYALKKFVVKSYESRKVRKLCTTEGRRTFIAAGVGIAAGLTIPRLLSPASATHLRPPASLPPGIFNTLCIRCGACIKACPTGILLHHRSTDDLSAWMTPELTFKQKGYCLEDCNLCAEVCPSGAINVFSVGAKKQIVIGRAEIDLDNCLLTDYKECDRCKSACKYDAVEIIPGKGPGQMYPLIKTEKCVGCGACAVICPTEVIEVNP